MVTGTPKIAVNFGQPFLTLRHFARRPGRQIEVPLGPPPEGLRAASVVGQGYTARLVGLSTTTGVPRGFGLILAPRDRHSAELGPDGLGAGGRSARATGLGFAADRDLS